MTTRKLKNLDKIWEEAGFKIDGYTDYVEDGELLELDLFIRPLKDQSRKFMDNWSSIKNASSRQGFYAMPIVECNHRGQTVVCLVKRESIYGMHKQFHQFIRHSDQSYWGVQGDSIVGDVRNKAMRLAEDIHQIQLHTKRMQSDTVHDYLFDNCPTYKLWEVYKKTVIEWIAEVVHCEKVADKAEEIAKEIQNAYVFNH